ncbi:hypothetical protein [Alicycliphilus denitrificans]|uniref:hypothetical protein n=1 Tax=Alicycliphilus denitrificans TaxID=179636 RepID=UPI003850ED11
MSDANETALRVARGIAFGMPGVDPLPAPDPDQQPIGGSSNIKHCTDEDAPCS